MSTHQAAMDVDTATAKVDSASADPANPSETLGGIAGHLRGLGASLCEHASLRAELAATEFQKEKRELAILAMVLVVFCALVATTLLFAGLSAVFLAWDSAWRDPVVIGVLFVYLLITGAVGLALARRLRQEHHPFPRTVDELRRDAAMLRRFSS